MLFKSEKKRWFWVGLVKGRIGGEQHSSSQLLPVAANPFGHKGALGDTKGSRGESVWVLACRKRIVHSLPFEVSIESKTQDVVKWDPPVGGRGDS